MTQNARAVMAKKAKAKWNPVKHSILALTCHLWEQNKNKL